MRGSATLDPEAAAKALRDAGLGMGEFAGGPPRSLPVVRAVLRPASGTTATPPAGLGPVLARELPAVAEAAVEPDGRLTLLLRPGDQPDPRALDALLGRQGWTASGTQALSWPASATPYLVTLRGNPDGAARARARAALERADGVLWAMAGPGRREFVVWLREPCASAADRLTPALVGIAGLSAVAPRATSGPASRPGAGAPPIPAR